MILTGEDGKKYEVVPGLVGQSGDIIVRPLPPPAKTAAQAWAAIGPALDDYRNAVPRDGRAARAAVIEAVEAFGAAVRAEEAGKRG